MKVRSIGSLFANQSTVGSDSEVKQKSQTNVANTSNQQGSEDAARVKLQAKAPDAEDRTKRVADLKASVSNGSYKPDIKDVATAIARDLL